MITRRPYSRRDTPDNSGKIPDQKPQRLNNKLSLDPPAGFGWWLDGISGRLI